MWTSLIWILLCAHIISRQSNVSHPINKEVYEDLSLHEETFPERSVPTTTCDDSRERKAIYNPLQTDTVWICKSGKWTPFKLTLSLGSTKDVPGSSCKEILQSHTSNCYQTPTDGVYWITLTDQCSKLQQTIQVRITTWKHPSYRKFTPSLLSFKRSGVI
jgi:hypothetical protein